MITKKLYAFWKYDTFPYVLGGEVKDINNKGLVYIVSYLGWFKPIIILPLEDGKIIHEKIKSISDDYTNEMKLLRKIKIDELFKICPWLKT